MIIHHSKCIQTKNFTWKLLNAVVGTQKITIPKNAKEFIIEVQYNNTAVFFTWHIIREQIATHGKNFYQGYHLTNTSYGICYVTTERESIYMSNLSINGVDYTSTSKLTVYYR